MLWSDLILEFFLIRMPSMTMNLEGFAVKVQDCAMSFICIDHVTSASFTFPHFVVCTSQSHFECSVLV